MHYIIAVDPPSWSDTNPYPNVNDPTTGAPFTTDRLGEIHRHLMDRLLQTVSDEIAFQAQQVVPAFISIYADASSLALRCLHDALSVANEGGDAGALQIAPTAEGVA